MKQKIRRTIRSFSIGYRKYYNEISKHSVGLQKQFSKHMAIIFFCYTSLMLMVDIFYWKEWNYEACYGYGVTILSLINWQLFSRKIPQRKKKTIMVGNIYLFLLMQSLVALNYLCEGSISVILLSCAILSTAMVGANPLHYGVMITVTMVFSGFLDLILSGAPIQMVMYYWIDDLSILVVALEICFLISALRYRQFKEKAQLLNESSTDSLTGLFNRKYFEQYFRRYYRSRDLSAMIHMDLDNFKTLNDTLGHEQGDALLCQVAALLRKQFRKSDCVARVGGDEFMVLMTNLPSKAVVHNKIKIVLEQFPIVIEKNEQRVEISISIGIVFSQEEKHSYTALYKMADEAMYEAKSKGKGRAVIYSRKRNKKE